MKAEAAGVYFIFCTPNEGLYIGSSATVNTRLRYHLYLLKRGKHHSPYFQHTFDKYGQRSFRFGLFAIEQDRQRRVEIEQEWIDRLKPSLNVKTIAGPGGETWSDEAYARATDRALNNEVLRTWAAHEIWTEWAASGFVRPTDPNLSGHYDRQFRRAVNLRKDEIAARIALNRTIGDKTTHDMVSSRGAGHPDHTRRSSTAARLE